MSTQPSDDLFEGTKMTFGEHLEELRVAVVRSLVGVILGVLIGLLLATHIVNFVQGPLQNALDGYYLTKAKEDLKKEYEGDPPPEDLQLIGTEHLVNDVLRVEPEMVLSSLKQLDPVFFEKAEVRRHRFVVADIRAGHLGEFCEQLKNEGESAKPTPGKKMWELLNADQRTLIKELAGAEDASETDHRSFVRVLNHLLEQPELHASDEFAGVDGTVPDDVAWLTAWWTGYDATVEEQFAKTVQRLREKFAANTENGEAIDAAELRRLNRFLIADAYASYLRRPQTHVVAIPTWKPTEVQTKALNAQEAFLIWLKAAFLAGLIIASPWIFLQVWWFVAAGLYPHEKKYVYIYLPLSLGLFLAGAGLAFFFVFKPVLDFLFSFNRMMNIDPDPRISEWLSFVLFLPLGFGIAFQLPLVMLFLNRIGVVSLQAFTSKWRIAILAIAVVSMLLTPADPISMMMMGIPLIILYFGGILLCKWMPRGRNPFAKEVYEP